MKYCHVVVNQMNLIIFVINQPDYYMKKSLSVLFLLLFVSITLSSQSALNQFINNPALKHASVGVHVVDLKSGETIVSHDSNKSLTPASITKIITTATALEMLGDNYRYETKVGIDAENPNRILVLGAGDPTLGSSVLDINPNLFFINIASAAKRTLSSDREYEILVVDNLFGYEGISPEWTWIDMGNYYAAGSYGISVFDNTYKLFFDTTNRKPRIIRTEPEMKDITFQNFLSLNTTGSDNGYLYGMPFSNERIIRGNIPAGRKEFSIKGDIPNPGLFLGETVADYLRSSGIKVGIVKTIQEEFLSGINKEYKIGTMLHTQVSPPLSEIVREVNVTSNNHYAEHLIRTIGNENDSKLRSLPNGINFIKSFWNRKGINTTSLTLYDGSGLAPQNAFSPQFLTDILVYMNNNSSHKKVFFDSLPKAGQEGTLRNFLKNSRYDSKISAKSGSIGGVHCYSGYLIDGEKQYAFTVMVNKFNGTRPQVRSAIEKFLLSL